jgi:hypothetical protein
MNYRKYIIKPALITVAILFVLYVVVVIYVTANKQSILKQVSESISQKLKGDVTIKNAELSFFSHFPRVAVELNGMLVKDSMFKQHGHAFFQAEKLFVYLSVTKLISKKNALRGVRVEHGRIYLYTDSTGYTNAYLLSSKKDSLEVQTSSPSILKNIILKNIRLTQDDRRREKMVDVLMENVRADVKTEGNVTELDINLKAHVHQLGFNLARGSYLVNKDLKGKFTVNFNTKEERLYFNDMKMDINGQDFNIGGEFVFGKARRFVLDISTKQIEMPFGMSVLTKRLAKNISKFKYSKAIDITAHIAGPLGGGEPLANISWAAKDVTITTPYAAFNNSSFTGSFNNELVKGVARNDDNSRINIQNFKGNWEGFDIASDSINIDNLTVPFLSCDLRSDFKMETLNNVLQSSTIDLKEGAGSMRIKYKGPLMPEGNVSPVVTGNITFKNGLVAYVPRNVSLKNCSAVIQFAGDDVLVKDMRFNVQQNQFTMNGSAAGLLTMINSNPDKIIFNWNVFTPSLDLGAFAGLLQAKTQRTIKKKANNLQGISNSLDHMLEKGSVRLALKANQVHYKKFDATNVNGLIHLSDDNWVLDNVSLNHGGGNMKLNGTVRAINNSVQAVNVRSQLTNVDVQKIMYAFGNFGQTGIESQNITGKLTADANVAMLLDRKLLKSSDMTGAVQFSLKNGALINYEPMQKLQSFFKNRDMRHVYFAELKDRLEIKNKEITINRMEIQSTAISLFVEGIFSLKGNTDISIQVPLNNIKRRDSSYVPQNIGIDSKAGASMYLRGKPGSDGKIKFSPDIFKKLRKK